MLTGLAGHLKAAAEFGEGLTGNVGGPPAKAVETKADPPRIASEVTTVASLSTTESVSEDERLACASVSRKALERGVATPRSGAAEA